METHVRVLGVLFLIVGGLCLLGALIILVVAGGVAGIVGIAAQGDPDAWVAAPIIGIIGTLIFILLVVLSIPGIVTGLGLLKRRPWARIVGIILSVLNLVNFPIGTVLGLYGLWVLLAKETEPLFQPAQDGGV